MREAGRMARPATQETYDYRLSPEGRSALALGMVALILGFGAVAAGAYVGLYAAMPAISLPGLAAADRGTVAMILSGCGALTTLLGGVSIYKAQEM